MWYPLYITCVKPDSLVIDEFVVKYGEILKYVSYVMSKFSKTWRNQKGTKLNQGYSGIRKLDRNRQQASSSYNQLLHNGKTCPR